jgi:SAM-dependent methyltransferase
MGFHPRRAWRALWSDAAGTPSSRDLKAVNVAYVEGVKATMPHERAMEYAIGDGFEEIGAMEAALVRHFGLPQDGYLVDVGCGAGRLARPLIDLVPDLVAHARKIAARPDWRFEVIDHIAIPEAGGAADMVCFFSVLTHLLHEQSYWYLEEARRVLKPGGRIVFSFLEFREPGHLPVFKATLDGAKSQVVAPMNVFIERGAIDVWARELGLKLVEFRDGGDHVVAEGNLGQALCVLEKP